MNSKRVTFWHRSKPTKQQWTLRPQKRDFSQRSSFQPGQRMFRLERWVVFLLWMFDRLCLVIIIIIIIILFCIIFVTIYFITRYFIIIATIIIICIFIMLLLYAPIN